jgi:hypothetical protein
MKCWFAMDFDVPGHSTEKSRFSMHNPRFGPACCGLVWLVSGALGWTPIARAQWTVTNLSPGGADSTHAEGAGDGQQVGETVLGGANHAALWTGAAASLVDLNPAGVAASYAGGVSGGQQVGWTQTGPWYEAVYHAALWSNTADSWVDLHPAGAAQSFARSVSGVQQVGNATIGASDHASLWTGTAASWLDLHPAGAANSYATGVDGGQQVGYASLAAFDQANHAILWSGTAASWVDLHPAGATSSIALGVSGGQQVGSAVFAGVVHAGVWSGTAASWLDLHPAGAAHSSATGVSGSFQVGVVTDSNSVNHASVWSGTAASWVDLSTFLPAGYSDSSATGVWSDGFSTYIVGFAHSTITDRDEAIMWSQTVCAPPSITSQPASAIACPIGSSVFSILAAGAGPLSYQWQIQTSPGASGWQAMGPYAGGLPCGGGGSYSATPINSPTVKVHVHPCPGNPAASQRFQIRCIVSSAWGSVASSEATYTICPADFDCSGTLAVADIFAFLNAWFAGDPRTDFDGVDGIQVQDIFAFLNAWFGGCS